MMVKNATTEFSPYHSGFIDSTKKNLAKVVLFLVFDSKMILIFNNIPFQVYDN